MSQKPGWLGFAGILDSACDDVYRNRSGCGCTAKGQKESSRLSSLPSSGANWTLLIRHQVPWGVRVSTPELGKWLKTLMLPYWMSSGSAATREVSPRSARIHLVGGDRSKLSEVALGAVPYLLASTRGAICAPGQSGPCDLTLRRSFLRYLTKYESLRRGPLGFFPRLG